VTRPRVLLADDHPVLIAAIGGLLATHYEIVGSVGDGVRLLEEAERLRPDVIVLDLYMPAMNGLDACRELQRIVPQTRVVVVTAEDDPAVQEVVLAAGAFAYIQKGAMGTDLLPAVKAACAAQDR
jgi:DNA-binding NarL/FixJ family response regulator